MSQRIARAAFLLVFLPASLAGCRSAGHDKGSPPTVAPPAAEPAAPPAAAPVAPIAPRPWEHEHSDVPVDPRVHFGALDNGLRFAWAENPEPQDRCYLRLHVDAGSLAEEDDELGMAHFLEHMAFNGSEHFPAGTLIEWFQSHGMAFGADTNAHTGFSETVYQVDLPECDAESLREGLRVLRDVAGGLLLAAEEIEREKGVIDGEERERDSPEMRVFEQQLDVIFEGTRVAERLPIGEADVRAAFTPEAVRRFYRTWYRPEHMTLVLVGDLGELDPAPLFAERFGDLRRPSEPLRAEPPAGRAARYAHRLVIHEPEIPAVTIAVERLRPWEEEPFTVAELLEDLPLEYARAMLDLRYTELAKQESTPFLEAGVGSAEALEVFDGESLSVRCAPERWADALSVAEQELRRAVEYGFRQAELDEVRARALRSLDEAVEREPKAHSLGLMQRLLAAAEERYVPADASARRAILRPAIEALTVEACHAAFREGWSGGEVSLSLVGDLDLGEDAADELAAAFESASAVAVAPPAEIATADFAYGSDPAFAGPLAERADVEDLGFTQLCFANGVAVNVKRTDFREQQIGVSAALGEGQLTLDPQAAELAWVGPQVFNGAGLEAHSEDDLRRLLAGRVAGVGFQPGEDQFVLGGETTPEDLLLQCELLCAYLEAPGWRTEGLIEFRRNLPVVFERLEHEHGGPLLTEFIPALFSGDPRFGLPTEAEAAAVEMEHVRAWLAPELAEAPLEVSLVGDLDVEQTIAIAARTFGMLPPRREWRTLDERRVAPAPAAGLRQTHAIDTEVPKSLVFIAFPVPDGIDVARRRSFGFLSTIVDDRLRVEVREKLGASYAPGAGTQLSTVFPGVGLLFIQAMADPEKVETLLEACLNVAQSLAADGITDEEVDRLREPILKQRRDAKRTNDYWLEVLSRSQRDPEHLDDVRSGDAFYESVTAADLAPLAREFLRRERASVLVVNPQ
jgi:zinc protease